MLAELFTLRPLFPGSSEADEVYRICSVLGTPTEGTWAEGVKLADAMHFRFPSFAPASLGQLLPDASAEALELIQHMTRWDPAQRPTAAEALQYPFFQVGYKIPRGPFPSRQQAGKLKTVLVEASHRSGGVHCRLWSAEKNKLRPEDTAATQERRNEISHSSHRQDNGGTGPSATVTHSHPDRSRIGSTSPVEGMQPGRQPSHLHPSQA
mmetsp:Transcript_276/g.907  ORF Transcript_276/g.907 Transcript_276/m.907 type:complete len:209 (+) Transcript_276:374-1000(+)